MTSWPTKSRGFIKRKKNALVNSVHRQKRLVMFHTGRCGSTVLAHMLQANSEVQWGGEIFNKYMSIEKVDAGTDFVKKIIQDNQNNSISRVYGFETKYLPQLHMSERCIGLNLQAYLQLLRGMGFNRFILLNRENYLRRAISAELARSTRVWHSEANNSKLEKVTINVNAFSTGVNSEPLLTLFKTMDRSLAQLKALLGVDEVLTLSYEKDILPGPEIAYQKFCKFAGIANEMPTVKLTRTNPNSIEEALENYSDVKNALLNTEYEWMLYQ